MIGHVVIALAAAALAQDVAPAPAPTAKPEKKLCRSETPTGSMMTVHVCHSRAEWAAIDAQRGANAQAFNDQRRRDQRSGQ